MSVVLGPVHHWLYKKINNQEEMTTRLLSLSEDQGLEVKMDAQFGKIEKRPLEEIIDETNIHGWLMGQVECVEERFAAVVQSLLGQEGISLDSLTHVLYTMGKEYSVERGSRVSTAYQTIKDTLLDGMPCDGGVKVVMEDEEELLFQCSQGIHALCIQEAQTFFALREAFISGMLEGSLLRIEMLDDGFYRIIKEA